MKFLLPSLIRNTAAFALLSVVRIYRSSETVAGENYEKVSNDAVL